MAEPTITCPNCKTEIKLTESLAAPLLEAIRRDFEQRIKQKDVDLAAKLKEEGVKVAADEARKARLALAAELDQRTRAVAELENALKENNAKLAEAQKAQAAVRASRQLARFYRDNATWAQVEPYMQCLFNLSSESRRSSAGDQFRRR